MVPLKYSLDREIRLVLTSKNQHPRRDWLKMVKTGRSLSRIGGTREEEQQTGQRMGREMLEGELKKRGSLQQLVKSGVLKAWLKENGYREIDTVFLQLAQGNLGSPRCVVNLSRSLLRRRTKRSQSAHWARSWTGATEEPVSCVGFGTEDISWPSPSAATLCQRTGRRLRDSGAGNTLHRKDCVQLLSMDPSRRIPEWTQSGRRRSRRKHSGDLRRSCRSSRQHHKDV